VNKKGVKDETIFSIASQRVSDRRRLWASQNYVCGA
jgi:hypothetical protein